MNCVEFKSKHERFFSGTVSISGTDPTVITILRDTLLLTNTLLLSDETFCKLHGLAKE